MLQDLLAFHQSVSTVEHVFQSCLHFPTINCTTLLICFRSSDKLSVTSCQQQKYTCLLSLFSPEFCLKFLPGNNPIVEVGDFIFVSATAGRTQSGEKRNNPRSSQPFESHSGWGGFITVLLMSVWKKLTLGKGVSGGVFHGGRGCVTESSTVRSFSPLPPVSVRPISASDFLPRGEPHPARLHF